MANHKGGTASPAWTKYDKLPHSLKVALQECKVPWAPGWLYERWNRGEPVKELLKYIKKIDRERAIKEARKVWGPGYPLELIK